MHTINLAWLNLYTQLFCRSARFLCYLIVDINTRMWNLFSTWTANWLCIVHAHSHFKFFIQHLFICEFHICMLSLAYSLTLQNTLSKKEIQKIYIQNVPLFGNVCLHNLTISLDFENRSKWNVVWLNLKLVLVLNVVFRLSGLYKIAVTLTCRVFTVKGVWSQNR